MMEASSRGGVRTWPNQVVTPSSSILHLSRKWNILHLHQNMESFKRRSASLIPLQWMLGAHRQLTGYFFSGMGNLTAMPIVYHWKNWRTPSSKKGLSCKCWILILWPQTRCRGWDSGNWKGSKWERQCLTSPKGIVTKMSFRPMLGKYGSNPPPIIST